LGNLWIKEKSPKPIEGTHRFDHLLSLVNEMPLVWKEQPACSETMTAAPNLMK
jgi:hypothetical protein